MSKKKQAGTEDALKYFERTRGPLTRGRTLAAIRETEEASLAAFAKRLGVSRTHLWDVQRRSSLAAYLNQLRKASTSFSCA